MTEEFTAHYHLPIPQFDTVPWHQQWEDSLRAVDEALYLSTITDAPDWLNSKQYFVGNMVLDAVQGTLWVAKVAHTSPASPTTFAQHRAANPTFWQGISTLPTFRGNWQSGVLYNINDFVISGSKYAVAQVAHISGASFAADEAAGRWVTLVDTGAAFVAINDITTASVPAAAIIDLGATAASRMLITGVAPGGLITSFGNAPEVFKILRFGSTGNTIVHNPVTLALPDGQNIAVQANDIFYFMSNSTGGWLLWGMLRKLTATDFDDIKQPASATYQGVVELATNAEAQGMVDSQHALVPANLAALVASGTTKGLIEIADNAETLAKTDNTKALCPANLAALNASTTATGLIELATPAEVQALTDGTRAVTPAGLASIPASATQQGIVELATSAETQLGTDTTRAVTAAGVASLVATTGGRGMVQLATATETVALTDATKATTPDGIAALTASTTTRGLAQYATDAETQALSIGTRAITPTGLNSLSASTTQRGISRMATNAEAIAMVNATVGVTPSNLAALVPNSTQMQAEVTDKFVTPAMALYANSAVKFWGTITTAGTLTQVYNLSSAVDSGVGIVQVAIDNDMLTVNYAVLGQALHAGGIDIGTMVADQVTTAFTLRSFNQAGTLTDPTRWQAIGSGTRV